MSNPRAADADLTAKARIRNAALDLYAEHGEDRVSLRAVAAAAGVTLGLVQHHFKTKSGLRDAVDQLVVDHFEHALREVPETGGPRAHAAARDAAVRRMLAKNPPVVNYLRRALLDPNPEQLGLLDALVELTRREVAMLRKAGLASTERADGTQVLAVLVRQMGELFLQPLVDAVHTRITDSADAPKPTLTVRVD